MARAPDTDWGTGPNQLWDGDVAWFIGEVFTSDLVQALWDQGLITECLLERPANQWPRSSATAALKCAHTRPSTTSTNSESGNCSVDRARPMTTLALRRTSEPSRPTRSHPAAGSPGASGHAARGARGSRRTRAHRPVHSLPSPVHPGGSYRQTFTRCLTLPGLFVGGTPKRSRQTGDTYCVTERPAPPSSARKKGRRHSSKFE